MSDSLKAQFALDFNVGSSSALERIQAILERIETALGRLNGKTIEAITAPAERAAAATNRFNETLRRTETETRSAASGASGLAATLTEASEAANVAATQITKIGTASTEAAEVATMQIGRVERLMGGLRTRAAGYGGGVVGAGRGFSEAVQSGIGSAFGAAAAGFGVLAPVHAAAEYDNDLAHIGIGLDLHGQANRDFITSYGMRLDALARQTGQRSTDLAAAAGFFNREGYAGAKLDAVLPTVARIATAYNAQPEAVAKTTFALQENLGINDKNLSGSLASIAIAGKQADLPFEALAPLFPQVAASAGQLGVKGRSGVNDLAAALAVVRKSTGTEGEAATDMRAFIQSITSSFTAKRFENYGVDLFGVEDNARKKGLDPIEAVLQQVNRITRGGQDRKALGELFHNEQDRAFFQAILTHIDQYEAIKKKVSAASPEIISQDFDTGLQSTLIRVQAFEDALGQLERRIGAAFVPVLNVATRVLHGLTVAFDWLDKSFHGLASVITGVVGAVLGLTAGLGAFGAIMIPLRAGLSLVNAVTAGWLFRLFGLRSILALVGRALVGFLIAIGPIGWAILGVTTAVIAGYEAWKHWDKIKPYLQALGHWIASWASWLGDKLMWPFRQLQAFFQSSTFKQWSDKAGAAFAQPGLQESMLAANGVPSQHGGKFELHVTHDPGVKVRQTSGPQRASIKPDRGRMVAIP